MVKKIGLEKAHTELLNLPNERRKRLAKLEAEKKRLQLQLYLDRFRIDRAKIPGIGPSRTSMLASYGIETANDINPVKIKKIPGFGEVRTANLVAWRKDHEKNFRYNPNVPIDPTLINSLDRELEARRKALVNALRQGPQELRRISQEVNIARPLLIPMLERAWETFKVAEARRQAL